MEKNPKRITYLLVVIVLVTIFFGFNALPVQAQDENISVYLPIVMVPGSGAPNECTHIPQVHALIDLIRDHPEQKRPYLTCNHILMQKAQDKADDMAFRQYFGHVNPDSFGPNYLVRQAGYQLPTFYCQSLTGNNIESIAAGYATVEAVWDGWMSSEGHTRHLPGLSSFFSEQVDFGIGYVYLPGSPFTHYWVVITARQ